ncbi:hypothetical protein BH11BAC5_BH11BAC5_48490 [soil metagenome]
MRLLNKKRMSENKKISLVVICLMASAMLQAQNNSSPYSVLGIGDIETSYFNKYTGMANAGVALGDERYINNSNAASLTQLREHFFAFETSMRFKQVVYSGAGVIAPDNKTTDFAVRRVNLAAKLTKNWGSSMGLMPFSTAAFNFSTSKNIQGTLLNVDASYQGQGGVNQFYWSNGYKLTKNTSIGVTSSLLFGSINQTEDILSNDLTSDLVTKSNIYLRNYYFNFSLQTKLKLSKKWQSTYGVTYTPKTSLYAEHSLIVTDGTTEIKNEILKNDFFALPETYNAGFALVNKGVYTYTVNAQTQNWSALKYAGSGYQLVNSNKLSIGFQHAQRARNPYGVDYEKGFFQMGLYAGNSYLKMDGHQIRDFGGSIGFSRNSKSSPLGYVLSLEAGRRGTTTTSQLSENYFNINLTFSYLEYLFGGRKYY